MSITLEGGKLRIPELSAEELHNLYKDLRIALLDSQIGHFRPVAFRVEGAMSSAVLSNITKIQGIGLSFSEMSFYLGNIITAEKRGVMPEQLQSAAALSKLNSDCSFMTLMGNTIGAREEGTMFYCGEGLTSTPNLLLNDTVVFKKLKSQLAITVVLMYGHTMRDFQDNQRLVYNTGFKPIRTYYSLYEYFTIKEHLRGEDFIQFNYNADINESVLLEILKRYFKERSESLVKG